MFDKKTHQEREENQLFAWFTLVPFNNNRRSRPKIQISCKKFVNFYVNLFSREKTLLIKKP